MGTTWRKDAIVSFELTNDMTHDIVTHDDNTKTDWLKAGKKRSGDDWIISATVQTDDTHHGQRMN